MTDITDATGTITGDMDVSVNVTVGGKGIKLPVPINT